ncbi:MAG: DoxX-like family protein [Polyangiaceae bacterium]|nr:DoxX-like family protein [Polyangiaceae bacterium]
MKAREHLTSEPVLRVSVALVWLATAVTCLHPFYAEVGTRYLAELGLGQNAQSVMYAACAGEGALGLYLLVRPFGRALAFAQIGAVAFFTFVLAWLEPMLLVSPFGLLSKNVPFVLVVWAAARLAIGASGEGEVQVLPILRLAAAIPWLTEGLFPKLLFQQEVELSMASRVGLGFAPAGLVVGTLGVLQIASFVLAFVLRGKALRALLTLQFAALLVLPIVVGALAPWLWVHPFGPFSKNLPILAATWCVLRHQPHRAPA